MVGHLSLFIRHRAGRATGLAFGATGLIFGSWAALIPFIKEKFDLDKAELGLLLLALPAGVVLMNPFSVAVLRWLGSARATVFSLILAAMLFILPFAMPALWLVAFSLFIAGAAFSSMNVSMNTCASQVEQRQGIRIMSTCHGLWSTGAMSGSALAGMATGWGMSPAVYVGILCLLELIIAASLWRPLAEVPDDDHPVAEPAKQKKTGLVMPNAALWLLISISLCTNLTEGAMADWSAVYMREIIQAPGTMAGWGFAVYAFFMAGGRFLGDELIGRFGSRAALRTCGILAALGLITVVLVNSTAAALAGFALTGMGVSLAAPILYAASARTPGMAKGAGLATMNTFAMAGFLGGPVFIGLLAKVSSLQVAFAVVAVFAGFWAWRAGRVS
ncbi:MAG: MFS transporter [Lewinellaceae bacterium]|nr:MFS transporter [Lewinella sp.]MCB9278100.1 MFS transporter [Lewinellaceae bacterium]